MTVSTGRTLVNQTVHDRMVQNLATHYFTQGYTVYADLLGYQSPPKVQGFIPDIYAVKGASKIIAEAETCETVCAEHTEQQFKVFDNVPGVSFHVITPESCIYRAKYCASVWLISVDKWWIEQGC